MPDYDPTQQRAIRRVFDRLAEDNCRYVIPRGYRELPGSVRGSDIEVFVDGTDFMTVKEVLEDERFSSGGTTASKYAKIARLGIRNPTSTIRTVLSRPRYVVSMLVTGDVGQSGEGTVSLRGQVEAPVFSGDGIKFHVHNHLAYKSPMFDRKVRVDPAVEEGMLERRRCDNGFFVPSPPDELLHLVCRGVFDYEGSFPAYYLEQCGDLWEQVAADEEWDATFQALLSDVFFAADELVYDHVATAEYNNLRDHLTAFADY